MTSNHEIFEKLRSAEPLIRFDALKAVTGQALDRDAKAAVIRIGLEDKHAYNRLQAVQALKGLWPAPEVVRVFSARLKDEQFVAAAVLEMLGEIADAQALGMITATFTGAAKTELKVAAVAALHAAPQKLIFDFLVRSNALNHRDEKIRAATVALLARHRNPTMKRIFLEKLKDNDARVRANAVEALGRIVSGTELARIIAPYAVADPNNRVRANSLVLLLEAGVAKAQEFLIQMAGHTDPRWRASAAYAMRHVPPTPYLAPWVRQLAQDADEQVASQAEMALPRFA